MWHQLEVPALVFAVVATVIVWAIISLRSFGEAMDIDYDAEDDLDGVL